VASDDSTLFEVPSRDELGVVGTPFDPRENGILTALINLVEDGSGAVLMTLFIGLASIPAGFFISAQSLIGALRSFLVAFIDAFMSPLTAAWQCAGDGPCTVPGGAVGETSLAVQAGGLIGFLLSMLVIGALAYIAAVGLGRFRRMSG